VAMIFAGVRGGIGGGCSRSIFEDNRKRKDSIISKKKRFAITIGGGVGGG